MDGFRAIAYVDDFFTIQSRNAKELKYFFPELEELRQLAKNVVVDGEIVTMKQGKVDFYSLQERGHLTSARAIERLQQKSPATFVVFDILEKDGQPLVDLPLIERKVVLKESVKEGSHIVKPPTHLMRQNPSYPDPVMPRSKLKAAIPVTVEATLKVKVTGTITPGLRVPPL